MFGMSLTVRQSVFSLFLKVKGVANYLIEKDMNLWVADLRLCTFYKRLLLCKDASFSFTLLRRFCAHSDVVLEKLILQRSFHSGNFSNAAVAAVIVCIITRSPSYVVFEGVCLCFRVFVVILWLGFTAPSH